MKITRRELRRIIAESADAEAIYKALDGWGTDEDAVKAVFAKRSGDLRALDLEYEELMTAKGESDKDLASWLDDDGMDDEVKQLQNAPLITPTQTAAQPAAAAPAAAADGSKPVTAPEVKTMEDISKIPGDSSQDPKTKQWTLPDGRITAPIALNEFKAPAAAVQQAGNFDGNSGKSLNSAGDAILMNRAGIDITKHLNVLNASQAAVKQMKDAVGALQLPANVHNKLSPEGMRVLGTFHQAVIDFEAKFNEALRYFHSVKGVEAGRAATGQYVGPNQSTAAAGNEKGWLGKAGDFLKSAIGAGSKVKDAFSGMKKSGTLNEMKMLNNKNRYSVVEVMSEMFENDTDNDELNEFKLFKTKDSELAGASTTDAYTLYKAMSGMGTDEKMVQKVIADRKNDLKNLSDEFAKLLQVAGEKDDLATWLTDDGMAAEAQLVAQAVAGGGTSVGAAQPAAPVAPAGTVPATAQMPQPGQQMQLQEDASEGLSRGTLIRRRYGRY